MWLVKMIIVMTTRLGGEEDKKAKGSKRQFHLKYRRKLTIRSQLMENTAFTVCVCVCVGVGLSAIP